MSPEGETYNHLCFSIRGRSVILFSHMEILAAQNMPLLELLALLSPESSKNSLRSWVEQGRVTLNGIPAKKANLQVNQGDKVAVSKRVHFFDQGIKILYEDEHLVVVDKPEGLLSVASDFEHELSAHGLLKRRFHTKRVYPVHRLDRETSGVMVFAYSEQARDGLKEQFAAHSITREYYAIVEGKIDPAEGTWSSFLAEDALYVVKPTTPDHKGAKHAITHYATVAQSAKWSGLRLTLETGRKNQIRVHCKASKHPVVGDVKYGSVVNPIGRLCLHAHKLGFFHPVKKKPLSFESPLPESFFSLLK